VHAGEEDHARPWMANIKTCTGLPVEESITMMEDGEIEKARPWVARYNRVVSVLDSRCPHARILGGAHSTISVLIIEKS